MHIEVIKWNPGIKVISLMTIVRTQNNLGLAEAKGVIDEFLDGKMIVVKCNSAKEADELRKTITELGGVCN